MSEKTVAEEIPDQEKGAKTDIQHEETYETEHEANEMFSLVVERLVHVNRWHDLTGKGTASFQLVDESNAEVSRAAAKGDRLKINIPGPGLETGHGFDWVQVEEIVDRRDSSAKEESFLMRVRPMPNPENDNPDVAHFFKDSATSSFMVERFGKKVITSVHGRNEEPNTESVTVIDKIRNAIVGLFAGAGGSYPQWKSLVVALQKPRQEVDQKS